MVANVSRPGKKTHTPEAKPNKTRVSRSIPSESEMRRYVDMYIHMCMYTYIYLYMYVCIYIYIYIYICIYKHTYIDICMYTYTYVYTYLHIFSFRTRSVCFVTRVFCLASLQGCVFFFRDGWHLRPCTPSPPTKSLDFKGFDSSKLLILKGGNYHVCIIV